MKMLHFYFLKRKTVDTRIPHIPIYWAMFADVVLCLLLHEALTKCFRSPSHITLKGNSCLIAIKYSFKHLPPLNDKHPVLLFTARPLHCFLRDVSLFHTQQSNNKKKHSAVNHSKSLNKISPPSFHNPSHQCLHPLQLHHCFGGAEQKACCHRWVFADSEWKAAVWLNREIKTEMGGWAEEGLSAFWWPH